jgi:hypothetical protein
MRNTEMAKRFLTFTFTREESEQKARNLAELSGDTFYAQVADVIKANGQNRKARRASKQRRAE